MLRRALPLFVLAVLLPGALSLGRAETAPLEQVRTTVDKVLATLKDHSLAGEARREKLSSIIRPRFDFEVMSRWVLGVNWRKASEEQRKRFIELFSDLLEATYIGKIESYTDERVTYGKEKIEGDRALVETTIVTSSADIPIHYRLVREGDEWLVYDVVIEEVSLVRNYRSTYDEIVRREGVDGLLKKMEEKLDELRAGNSQEQERKS